MPEAAYSINEKLISVCDAMDLDQLSHADLIAAVDTVHKLSEANDMATFCDHLLTIAKEKIGAAKGLLFLMDDSNNAVVHSAFTVADKSENMALALAEPVIDYAAQKQKIIILDDGLAGRWCFHDARMESHRPQSILCIPLIYNQKTEAVLYLEDAKVEKASMKCQLAMLCFILSQAAPLLRHNQRYQMTAESENRYRQLYEQQAAKAHTQHHDTIQITHDIRASINAILAYSDILKEALADGQSLDRGRLTRYIDQIIYKSWHLSNLFTHGANHADAGSGIMGSYREEHWFDENSPLLTNDSS